MPQKKLQSMAFMMTKRLKNASLSAKGESVTDINVGDILVMKKSHPCGCDSFLVLRIGADFRLRCQGCSHEIMIPRSKAEKNVKKIIKG